MTLVATFADNFLVPNATFFVELVFFLVVVLGFGVLWIWSLVDALRFDDRRWSEANQSKLLWVLLIVFLGLLGSLLYAFIPRPALRATS